METTRDDARPDLARTMRRLGYGSDIPEGPGTITTATNNRGILSMAVVGDQAEADGIVTSIMARSYRFRTAMIRDPKGPIDLSHWLPRGRCRSVGPREDRSPFRCGLRENHPEPWHRAEIPKDVPWAGGMMLDWVIYQGGTNPVYPSWVYAVRDRCQMAGVPFWFDSWGDWIPIGHGGDGMAERFPGGEAVREQEIILSDLTSRALLHDGRHLPDLTGRGRNGVGSVRVFRAGRLMTGRRLAGQEITESPDDPGFGVPQP